MVIVDIDWHWSILAFGSSHCDTQWIVDIFCSFLFKNLVVKLWSGTTHTMWGGRFLQALLPTGLLDKIQMCSAVPIRPGSKFQEAGEHGRNMAIWREPNLLSLTSASLLWNTRKYCTWWSFVLITHLIWRLWYFVSVMFENEATLGVGLCPSGISVVI